MDCSFRLELGWVPEEAASNMFKILTQNHIIICVVGSDESDLMNDIGRARRNQRVPRQFPCKYTVAFDYVSHRTVSSRKDNIITRNIIIISHLPTALPPPPQSSLSSGMFR